MIFRTGITLTDKNTRTSAGSSACSSVSTKHCLIFSQNRLNRYSLSAAATWNLSGPEPLT